MSVQGSEQVDWEWFTMRRIRVLRELALENTEREAAENIGCGYASVRSAVQEFKDQLGLSSIREIRRWWREHRDDWFAWAKQQGGFQ